MVEHSRPSLNPISNVFQPISGHKKYVGRGLGIADATRCPFCLTIGQYLARIRLGRSDIVPSPILYVVADQLPVAIEHSEASPNPIFRVFPPILRCEKHVGSGLGVIGPTRFPILLKNQSIFDAN